MSLIIPVYPPRLALGHFPTPIEKLDRLTRHLGGPEIFVKRDDQTGLATGGNKTRKLEFIVAEAQASRCNHLITVGGPQSNHCRQTAAAAARVGMKCSVVLRGSPPPRALGNLLLDELLGAQVHWAGNRTREAVAEELTNTLQAAGERPYLVPLGGSTPLGAMGYVAGMLELLQQLQAAQIEIDTIVVASSSGGTQAGMALGAVLAGSQCRVLGISIDAVAQQLEDVMRGIAVGCAARLASAGTFQASGAHLEDIAGKLRLDVNDQYLGGGYSIVGDLEREAIRTMARLEGLLLDPVYTGRAFGALMDLIRCGTIGRGQRVLFWHTGGAAALSAFSAEMTVPQ